MRLKNRQPPIVTIGVCVRNCATFIASAIDSIAKVPSSFDKIFVISTIEHIEKDNLVAKECGRILKKDGYCVLSLPFSKLAKEPLTSPYFSRFYTRKLIEDRIIVPSLLSLKELFFFNKVLVSTFYACVPEGWFIFKDLAIGLTLFKLEGLFLSKNEGTLAIIKLHKSF